LFAWPSPSAPATLGSVAFLGVVAVDLLPRVSDFLGDDVCVGLLDDALDRGVFVPWDENESIAVCDDSFVVGGPDFDLLDASCVVAFAVERRWRVDAVLFRSFFDPRVDLAKGVFVSCGALGEIHLGILL
jgi:hypothetical protein